MSLGPEVRWTLERRTTGYSLLGTFPSLSFLAFFLRLLASAVLNTLLLRSNAWNDIVERVLDDANRLDLWRTIVCFRAPQRHGEGA